MNLLFLITVPTVNVSITSIGGIPMVGRPYNFTCDVVVENDFGQRILYSFLQNNEIITNQSSEASLEFTHLSLADAGIYECSVEISSDLLINNIVRTTMQGDQIVNLTSEFPVNRILSILFTRIVWKGVV